MVYYHPVLRIVFIIISMSLTFIMIGICGPLSGILLLHGSKSCNTT